MDEKNFFVSAEEAKRAIEFFHEVQSEASEVVGRHPNAPELEMSHTDTAPRAPKSIRKYGNHKKTKLQWLFRIRTVLVSIFTFKFFRRTSR